MFLSKKSLLPATILFLSHAISQNSARAMHHEMIPVDQSDHIIYMESPEESDDEMSDVVCTFGCLSINRVPDEIAPRNYAFAQRYILHLYRQATEQFQSMSASDKEKLMERFNHSFAGFRSNDKDYEDEKLKLAIDICQSSYESLLPQQQEEELLKDFQDFFNGNNLSESTIQAILIKLLDSCDHGFKGLGQEYKESLSIRDLRGEWRRICGHSLTTTDRVLMAITGAQDASWDDVGKGFLFLGGAPFLVFFLLCWGLGDLLSFIVWISSGKHLMEGYIIMTIVSAYIGIVVLPVHIGINCANYYIDKKL